MTDEPSIDELYDLIIDIIYEHFARYKGQNAEELDDETYDGLVYICTDKIIKAKFVGEKNAIRSRKEEIQAFTKLKSIVQILDGFKVDDLSLAQLCASAISTTRDSQKFAKLKLWRDRFEPFMKGRKFADLIVPVLDKRLEELKHKNDQLGKRNIVAELVAAECRVAWHQLTGQKAADNFGDKLQAPVQFVDAVFDVLFKDEAQQPSARTALNKSAARANQTINAIGYWQSKKIEIDSNGNE